jgi:hypothetical protein
LKSVRVALTILADDTSKLGNEGSEANIRALNKPQRSALATAILDPFAGMLV